MPVFVEGEQVYESPKLEDIREYSRRDLASFWEEYKRLVRPHKYKVDLSDKLFDLKKSLMRKK